MPELVDPLDLATDRSSFIVLLRSVQEVDYERAAWSLNLQDISQDKRRPAHLANLFYDVLTQTV